jgi:hypothetical protein
MTHYAASVYRQRIVLEIDFTSLFTVAEYEAIPIFLGP